MAMEQSAPVKRGQRSVSDNAWWSCGEVAVGVWMHLGGRGMHLGSSRRTFICRVAVAVLQFDIKFVRVRREIVRLRCCRSEAVVTVKKAIRRHKVGVGLILRVEGCNVVSPVVVQKLCSVLWRSTTHVGRV